jgi:hypothetical protein
LRSVTNWFAADGESAIWARRLEVIPLVDKARTPLCTACFGRNHLLSAQASENSNLSRKKDTLERQVAGELGFWRFKLRP